MAWLTGWGKRKKITLTGGSSGAQTDYQLKLTVAYDSDMQADFDDLRFTKADGTTLIDAWLEEKTDSTSAIVWVEFPTTPANTVTEDYYMYYGNSGVSNIWNIDNTFLFADDFSSVTDWTYSGQYGCSSYSFTTASGEADMMASASNDFHRVSYKKTANFNVANTKMLLRFKGTANTEILIEGTSPAQWRTNWLSSPLSYTRYDEAWTTTSNTTEIEIHTKGTVSGTQHNYFDFIAFHKYVTNPSTYGFGEEEGLGHPTMKRWGGIPGMRYLGRNSW